MAYAPLGANGISSGSMCATATLSWQFFCTDALSIRLQVHISTLTLPWSQTRLPAFPPGRQSSVSASPRGVWWPVLHTKPVGADVHVLLWGPPCQTVPAAFLPLNGRNHWFREETAVCIILFSLVCPSPLGNIAIHDPNVTLSESLPKFLNFPSLYLFQKYVVYSVGKQTQCHIDSDHFFTFVPYK